MKLAVGYSYYQDVESIRRGFSTFIDHVDYVFAIDGKYTGNPAANDFSNDGSTEFIKQWDNVVYKQFLGYEYEKRQQYCNLCKEYDVDYLFIIDSDEFVLEADWDLFKSNIEAQTKANPNQSFFGVEYKTDDEDISHSFYPRIWYKPYMIQYAGAHCIFQDNRTGVITSSGGAIKKQYFLKGLLMGMNDKLRSKECVSNTFEYQKKMIAMEKSLRENLH